MRVPEAEFVIAASRSGGPGGQNVNKVNTRVTVTFDVRACTELSEAERQRVVVKLKSRVTAEGVLRVTSSRFRTQRQNRNAAIERMYELLAGALAQNRPRRRTGVPRSQRQRRLAEKRSRSETKAQRQGNWKE